MAARKTLYIVFATLTTTISSFLMEWLVSAKRGYWHLLSEGDWKWIL